MERSLNFKTTSTQIVSRFVVFKIIIYISAGKGFVYVLSYIYFPSDDSFYFLI